MLSCCSVFLSVNKSLAGFVHFIKPVMLFGAFGRIGVYLIAWEMSALSTYPHIIFPAAFSDLAALAELVMLR